VGSQVWGSKLCAFCFSLQEILGVVQLPRLFRHLARSQQGINLSPNSSYCCLIISTVAGVMHVQTQYSAIWNIPWYLYQNTAQVAQRSAAKWKPNVTRAQPEIPTKSFTKHSYMNAPVLLLPPFSISLPCVS